MTKQITYDEIPAPHDQCYHELWPEIIGTNCWICTSHDAPQKVIKRYYFCNNTYGLCIIHKCDRGREGCINPLHIVLGTHKENMQDMSLKKRIPINKLRTYNTKGVVQLTMNNIEITRFSSGAEAARSLGWPSANNIYKCCKNKIKSTLGFKFQFI